MFFESSQLFKVFIVTPIYADYTALQSNRLTIADTLLSIEDQEVPLTSAQVRILLGMISEPILLSANAQVQIKVNLQI